MLLSFYQKENENTKRLDMLKAVEEEREGEEGKT